MNIFLIGVFCYAAIGFLFAGDYLLRLALFNRKSGASWSEYEGLFAQSVDFVVRWPMWLWRNLIVHYSAE